jgi:hypothetical protein
MMMWFSSFVDEMVKIAEEIGPSRRLLQQSQGDVIRKLLVQQEVLAPLEGSNENSRLRYLWAKAKGLIPKNDQADLIDESENLRKGQGELPFGGNLLKTSAIGGDLRRSGIGGTKRPPFPTDDSLQLQRNNLRRTQGVARFNERTARKMLRPRGLSISATSTSVGRIGKTPTVATSPYSP